MARVTKQLPCRGKSRELELCQFATGPLLCDPHRVERDAYDWFHLWYGIGLAGGVFPMLFGAAAVVLGAYATASAVCRPSIHLVPTVWVSPDGTVRYCSHLLVAVA